MARGSSKSSKTGSTGAKKATKKRAATKAKRGSAGKSRAAGKKAATTKAGAGKKGATKKAAGKKSKAPATSKKRAPSKGKAKTKTGRTSTSESRSRQKRAPVKATSAGGAAAVALATAPPPADPVRDMGLVAPTPEDLPPVKFSKRDLAAIEKALHASRDQLSQDVEALTQNNLTHSGREMSGDLSGYGFHMADVATDNFAREMELNIATGETNRLRLLEEALDRLREGTFGRCLVCSEPVGVARLKVIPYARLCIRCAEEAERS